MNGRTLNRNLWKSFMQMLFKIKGALHPLPCIQLGLGLAQSSHYFKDA